MPPVHRLIASCLFVIWTAIVAPAQDPFLEQWAAAASKNPPDVNFRIRFPGDKSSWNIGEVIPLHLEFSSPNSGKWLASAWRQDRAGHLDEFHLDPSSGATDPLEGIPRFDGVMAGVVPRPYVLSADPVTIVHDLNEWVRFEQPGSYRLYATTRRLCLNPEPERADGPLPHCWSGDQIEAVSNVITLDISEPPQGWAQDQFRAALKALDAPKSDEVDRGARILRFLGTPEAAEEMARRLGEGTYRGRAFELGILSSPHRAKVLSFMEHLLVAPGQPVTVRFVEAMASLFMLENRPPRTPFPQDDPSRQEAWQAQGKTRREEELAQRDKYYARLAKALGAKENKAAGACGKALLAQAQTTPDRPAPEWLASTVTTLRNRLPSFSEEIQRDLLSDYWTHLAGSEMVSFLKRRYEEPSVLERDPSIHELILRRLYELSPQDGRKLIMDQLRERTVRVDWETLLILSDRSLPELNENFAGRLEGGENVALPIARYADAEILRRVKRAYEIRLATSEGTRNADCISPLHFYFLRFDPDYGTANLERILSDETPTYPRCRDLAFAVRELGRSAASPALERFAVKYVNRGSVAIKTGAAEVLGRIGTATAEKPLWEAMAYFHEWWKGRQKELEQGSDYGNQKLERTYSSALAQANGWFLDTQGLSKLRDLCITDGCRGEVSECIRRAQSPLPVHVQMFGSRRFNARVAQYDLRNEDDLYRKLKQFPAGTEFRWETRPAEHTWQKLKDVRNQMEQIIRSSGGVIVP